jgi:hypothetical protein
MNAGEAKLKLRDQILVLGFVPYGDIRPTDLGRLSYPTVFYLDFNEVLTKHIDWFLALKPMTIMFNSVRLLKWMALAGLAMTLSLSPAQTAILWDETIGGDLSNDQSAPNAFTLGNGVNSVIGTVGTEDTQDWIALTVPVGFNLNSVVLSAYVSIDVQGFTGFQFGSSFTGSPFVAGSYAGFVHFGTAARNGGLPMNLVGQDLIPLMADNSPGGTASGATGFTPPLGAGTYTFLIQQQGVSTAYQFDYDVTPVPEPGVFALAALGVTSLFAFRRHKQ